MVKLSAVWGRTTAYLAGHWRLVAPLVAGAIAAPAVIVDLLFPLVANGRGAPTYLAGAIVLLLVLIGYFAEIVVMTAAMAPEQGLRAWRLVLRRLPVLIGVGLVLAAGLLVLIMPVAAIPLAFGVPASALVSAREIVLPSAALGAMALALGLLLPLLLLLGTRLISVPAIIVAEGLGLRALGRSFALTRGVALRLAGLILLYLCIVLSIGPAADAAIGAGLADTVATLVSGLAGAGIAAIAAVFRGKLYLALAARDSAAGRAAVPA